MVFINLRMTVMHYSSSNSVLIVGPILLEGNIMFLLLLVKSLGMKKPMNSQPVTNNSRKSDGVTTVPIFTL
jgi:hypothetical protein